MQRRGAPVDNSSLANGEPPPLQLVQQRDEVCLLDAECPAHLALADTRVLLDDGKHRELRRTQSDFLQRSDKLRHGRHLRAPQCVPKVLRERSVAQLAAV